MTFDFDDFLTKRIGGLGKWHFLYIVTFTLATLLPLEYFAQFAFNIPEHHCWQPQLVNSSWSDSEIVNLSIPFKSDPYDTPMIGQAFYPCKEYDLDDLWEHLKPNVSLTEALELRQQYQVNLTIRPCQHGVAFVMDQEESGVFGVEFHLTCERQHFIPLSNTAYFVGMLVGFFISGPIADRFGRRMVCIVCPFIYAVTGVSTSFVQNIWWFIALRFATAISNTISYLIGFVYAGEWLNIDQRNIFGFYRKSHYAIVSRGLLSLCFYIMPSWRYAYASYFLLVLPVFSGFFLWFESPRWLLSKGRIDEAEANILSVIRINGIKITEEEEKNIREELEDLMTLNRITDDDYQSVEPKEKLKHSKSFVNSSLFHNFGLLFCTPRFRSRILIWLLVWIIVALLIIGIQFNAVRLGYNPFLIALFSGLMAVPGSILQYTLYRFFDRKRPITWLLGTVSSLLVVAFVLTLFRSQLPVVVMCTVCTILMEALFTMLYIRTPEVFPTSLRSISFGLCAATSRFGMVIASYVERLDQLVWAPLPLLVFSIASIIATILSFSLTAGKGSMEEWQEESVVFHSDSDNDENSVV